MRKTIVAGNWKLHGSRAFATGLVGAIAAGTPPPEVELVVLPPLPYLGELVAGFGGGPLAFGAQDVSSHQQGAWTGEVAASMLAEAGARYVLVGHSERRQYHGEDSELVARKLQAALQAGLVPVLCVGEGLAQRDAGQAQATVAAQLQPVLDAHGKLIGLAFDGNWESVSSNWVFDPAMTRMIAVDGRYLRWVMQEVYPAPQLLKEMNVGK